MRGRVECKQGIWLCDLIRKDNQTIEMSFLIRKDVGCPS